MDWIVKWSTPALLVSLRMGGLMSVGPFLGSLTIPARVKATLTLAIVAVLVPTLPPFVPELSVGLVLQELGVGLLLGLALQLVIEAAVLAGQSTGLQVGFSLVNIIDPQTNVDTPVFSLFFQTIVLLLFLRLDVHLWILRAAAASYRYLPPGSLVLSASSVKLLLQMGGGIWLVAVQVAAPVIVATMVVDIALAFAGRAAPQLPVLFVGMTAKALVAYGVLLSSVLLWPSFFERRFIEAIAGAERLLHIAH